MESTTLNKKIDKLWNFRKIPKLINHFQKSFPKIFKLVFLKSEKNEIEVEDSINLKFTKFSIYFKATEKKSKNLLTPKEFNLLVLRRNIPRDFKKIRKCKVFSIYQKNLLIRIKSKTCCLNKNYYSYKNLNCFYIKRKPVMSKTVQQFSTKFLISLIIFKRNIILFTRSSKVKNIIKRKNQDLKFDFFYKKEFELGLAILPKKINRIVNDFKLIFFFLSFFSDETTILIKNFCEGYPNNFYNSTCEELANNQYVSFKFFLKTIYLKYRRKNLKKNGDKRSRLKFFHETTNLIITFLPEKKFFFNFLATFSFVLGWKFRIIKGTILNTFNFKQLPNISFLYTNSSKFFSGTKSFFLKESNLILHLISKSIFFNSQLFSFKSLNFNKSSFFDFKYEIKEILKNLDSFKISHIFIFWKMLSENKKKHWYRNSETFFWYFFSKFKASFSLSFLSFIRISKKLTEKISRPTFNSIDFDNNCKIGEIYQNILKKKGIKTSNNKKKNSKSLLSAKRIQFTQKFSVPRKKKRILSRVLKSKKFLSFVNICVRKSKFPGYTSLKKIGKIKKITDYYLKHFKNNKLVKKKEHLIQRNMLFYVEVCSNEPKTSFIQINKKFYYCLKWETFIRSGYIFHQRKVLKISFVCLTKIVKSNRKEIPLKSIDSKIFKSNTFKQPSFFNSLALNPIDLENIIDNYRFHFIFDVKINKTIEKFQKIREIIKKLRKIKKNFSIRFSLAQEALKEDLVYEIFDNFYKKFYIKNYVYSYDIVSFFFLLYKLFYINMNYSY